MIRTARPLLAAVAATAIAVTIGCDDKAKIAPPVSTDAPIATAAPVAALDLSDDDVPVAEDYIEEATKEIDENNLTAKLDELEKEIDAKDE